MSSVWHDHVSDEDAVLFCFLSVWVTPGCEEPSAFVTANQTKWGGGGREDCSSCILWGFFRSASNLYATRVMGIPRETIPLVSETMQNATLISTDFSVKCSASQAIELGAQCLVFQHPPSPGPEPPTDPPTGPFFSNRQGLTAIDVHDTTNRTRRQKFFRCRFLLSSLRLWILGIRRGGSVWIHATGKKKKKKTFGQSGKETPVFSEQFFHWGWGRHCMWWNSALVLEWFDMSSCSAVSLCLPVSLQSVGRCCQTRWPSYILSGFVVFFFPLSMSMFTEQFSRRKAKWMS